MHLSITRTSPRRTFRAGTVLATFAGFAVLTLLSVCVGLSPALFTGQAAAQSAVACGATRARVTFSKVANTGLGHARRGVTLGDGTFVPEGQWFDLVTNGQPVTDSTLVLKSPYLSIRRLNGQLEVLEYGQLSKGGDANLETVYGTLEIANGTFTSFHNDTSDFPGHGADYLGDGTYGSRRSGGIDDEIFLSPDRVNFFLHLNTSSDSFTANYQTPSCPAPADLAASLSIPPQLEPKSDQDLPEVWGVTNVGSVPVSSAVLTQALPAGIQFNPALSNSACTSDGATVRCTVGTVYPGQSLSFIVYLLVPSSQPCNSVLTKQVTVTSSSPDVNPWNDTASASTFVTCPGIGR